MDGRFNWLPGQAKFWGMLAVWLIPPALAFAQQEPAGPSNDPAAQAAAAPQAGSGKAAGDILNLDIEQLARTPVVVPSMDIPVTSVTKTPSTVGHSAAAVFVITPEMIRRSGATSIPEALRMAPGLDVAQVNSNTWAITSRGFNSAYAYRLLVLIDGRTVYNPDFSGVLWNAQDVLLEDVERIEVIRGPGGTLWGANAVNGVINIITKKAKDTQGVYAMAGGGSQLKDAEAFRYGGRIGEDLQYRIYGKHFEQGADFDPTGQVNDSWRQGRFGFRADWEPDRDKTNTFTIQGDHYVGTTNNSFIPTSPALPERQNGENLLARWHHVCDEDSDWTLQMYYDNFMVDSSLQTWNDKTFDVDFQYRFPLTDRHKITCGGGFRNVDSYVAGGDTFTTWYPSPYFATNYTNEFIQDEMAIIEDKLNFTLGCKLEQNPYTGLEYEPTARLLWMLDRRHSAWGAVSRAVRTPSRSLNQISSTVPQYAPGVYPRILGNDNARTEAVLSYELGYREQATEQFSWDIALFYNAYDRLMDTLLGTPFGEMVPAPPHLVMPLAVDSGPTAETYGAELTGNYSVSERWRLYTQYSLLQLYLHADPTQNTFGGNAPCNQVYLRSAWDLNDNLEFDMTARYVDRLVDLQIPSYITMDLRLAWRPRKQLELAVVGQNLLQDHHWEFAGNTPLCPTYATEVPRGVYGTLTWRY